MLDSLFLLSSVSSQLFFLLPTVFVNAAVISRSPGSSSHFYAEARSVDDATSHSQQFVLPWSSRKPGDSSNHRSSSTTEKRRFHKVRTTNPIQRFADAVVSRIKHSGGHRKRSHKSIIIPTGHGKNYLIPHARRQATTPQWISGQTNTTTQSNTTQASTQNENTGVPGVVRIQSQSSNSTQGPRTLGSLFMTNADGIYTLNASENNETHLFMVNVPSSTTRDSLNPNSTDNFPVYLVIPSLQDHNDYCATYNNSPDKLKPMTMQQCNNYTATDGSSTSQTFMFNQRSGEIRPTWVDAANGTTQAASVSNDTDTNLMTVTDTATSAQSTSTGLNQRDDTSVNTQNVTLIWVPSGNMQAADISEASNDSQFSASSAITTTMTQTVTVFHSGTTSSASPSASGLNVEVVGSTPKSSASLASSMAMMDLSSSSISSPSASPTSSSFDAAAIASSIASSVSASMSSASAMASAADFSASASTTSTSDPSSNTFVEAIMQRSPWVKAETR